MKLNWKGAWAAIPTPFRGEPDLEAYSRHLTFLLNNGIDGIVAVATTGEAATMTELERQNVVHKTVELCHGRVPVIMGVGTNDTRSTIANALLAKKCGVDGVLAVTPYYNKPNQEGLYRHFMMLADSTDLPILVYNVPGRTGSKCLPETFERLVKHPNIVGTKDATGDMVFAANTRLATNNDFIMFSGDDDSCLPFMSIGGVGVISVVANIAPRLMHDLCESVLNHNLTRARELYLKQLPLCQALFSTTSPIPLKMMLSRGHIHYPPELRMPLCELTKNETDALCAPFADFINEVIL